MAKQEAKSKNKNKLKKEVAPVKKGLDFASLGERIRFVRENILKLSQTEMADHLGSNQVMVSRLEKGIGGSFEFLMKLLNFLYTQGVEAKELFALDFSKEAFLLSQNAKTNYLTEVQDLINNIKNSVISDLDRLHSYTALLKYQNPNPHSKK